MMGEFWGWPHSPDGADYYSANLSTRVGTMILGFAQGWSTMSETNGFRALGARMYIKIVRKVVRNDPGVAAWMIRLRLLFGRRENHQ